MARFKLTIEYDGTAYKGWQMNKGETTVQGKLIDVCESIFGKEKLELYGAGRTDAGVHATGQVAHLDVVTTLKPLQIQHKINDFLPATINVLSVEQANPRFHARHHATARSYIYVISSRRSALFKKNVWWIKDKLDVEAMRQSSKLFIGLKDFRSFGRVTKQDESTKVEIQHIGIHQQGSAIVIHIIGSHFLWNQVRRMIGVLVEIGRGNMKSSDITEFMTHESDRPAHLTAPPSGLYLDHVYYDNEKPSIHPVFPVTLT
jgi:tRNA pseudouridine38-40 synthase